MTGAMLERFARLRVLGRSPFDAYVRVNDLVWNRFLPRRLATWRAVESYGRLVHSLVVAGADRRMYLGTFFLLTGPSFPCSRACASQGEGRRAGAHRGPRLQQRSRGLFHRLYAAIHAPRGSASSATRSTSPPTRWILAAAASIRAGFPIWWRSASSRACARRRWSGSSSATAECCASSRGCARESPGTWAMQPIRRWRRAGAAGRCRRQPLSLPPAARRGRGVPARRGAAGRVRRLPLRFRGGPGRADARRAAARPRPASGLAGRASRGRSRCARAGRPSTGARTDSQDAGGLEDRYASVFQVP